MSTGLRGRTRIIWWPRGGHSFAVEKGNIFQFMSLFAATRINAFSILKALYKLFLHAEMSQKVRNIDTKIATWACLPYLWRYGHILSQGVYFTPNLVIILFLSVKMLRAKWQLSWKQAAIPDHFEPHETRKTTGYGFKPHESFYWEVSMSLEMPGLHDAYGL